MCKLAYIMRAEGWGMGMTKFFAIVFVALPIILFSACSGGGGGGGEATAPVALTAVTSNGITWTFAAALLSGTFVTGDPWVLGPVTITKISTDLHAPSFTPGLGQDGSMLNPGVDMYQGYDDRLTSYKAELNAGLIGGRLVSPDNPLMITGPASLVSMISWLHRSAEDAEPGIPEFNGGTHQPRPVTRSGAVLTVLTAIPAAGSFRPAYSTTDRTPHHTIAELDLTRLASLAPVKPLPDPARLVKDLRGPWFDHVHQYLGAMVHPSQNMPNYGRDMANPLIDAALLLNLDATAVPGLDKTALAIPLVQFGLDCAGIADAGGGWPANGGHHLGRKLPILVAGLLLNDRRLQAAGTWKTRFHDDEQTFYVDEATVTITASPEWSPDPRANPEPYTAADLGMPEWGITHALEPHNDNRAWGATYRDVNAPGYIGTVLAARIMGLHPAWNHQAFFDYGFRAELEIRQRYHKALNDFKGAMWLEYASRFVPKPAWYRR